MYQYFRRMGIWFDLCELIWINPAQGNNSLPPSGLYLTCANPDILIVHVIPPLQSQGLRLSYKIS